MPMSRRAVNRVDGRKVNRLTCRFQGEGDKYLIQSTRRTILESALIPRWYAHSVYHPVQ